MATYYSLRAVRRIRNNNIECIPGDPASQDFIVDASTRDLLVGLGVATLNGVAPAPAVLKPLVGLQAKFVDGVLAGFTDQSGSDILVGFSGSAVLKGTQGAPYSGHSYFPMSAGLTNLTSGPVDMTGNGRNMALGAAISAAQCNANAGYMTTVAAVNGHIASVTQANWATDLLIMSFVINMAVPGGLVFIAGSNNYVATETGLSFGVATDGKLRVYVAGAGSITAGGGLAYLAGANVVIADGTDHKVGIAYDYKQRAIYIWVDGVLVQSIQNALAVGAGAWTQPFVWGTNKPGTACQAIKLKNVNIYCKTGAVMPCNVNTFMATFSATPQDIGKLFDQTTKHVALYTAGQSNQAGYGGTGEAINTGVGSPIKDPLYPKGSSTKRSMWPSLAGALGAQGYSLTVHNHAQGSSGLFANWVGAVVDYSLNGYVKLGSFVAYGGRVFKASTSGGINDLPQMSTPPTAGGTDGVITWTDVGVDTGFRGPASSGSPYFDPNGYIAGLIAALTASDSPRKVVYVAFGETDANMGISRANYAAALVSFVNAVLAAGAQKVAIGHTFGTAQFLTQYNTSLVPGMQDALASFSADSRVFAGFNGYSAFGALPTSPASGLGFIADNLHANDATYDAAGAVFAATLIPQLATL